MSSLSLHDANELYVKLGAALFFGAGVGYLVGRSVSSKSGKKAPKKIEAKGDDSAFNGFDNARAKAELLKVFPKYVKEFVQDVEVEYKLPKSAIERLAKVLNYNCIGGKYYRGVLTVDTVYQICKAKGKSFSPYFERALVLGWCIEILQASFLVADDIMDRSETRRGQPCWYKQPEVQMDAVNDTIILESFLYFLLKKYFTDPDLYQKVDQLYHQVSLATQLGQMLDLTAQPQGRKDPEILKNFTRERYMQIVKYKTCIYTFYLPMASGMLLLGYDNPKDFDVVRNVCIAVGTKFQIQDDYLDCFQDPKILGKIGTDIKDHKCSWLMMLALGMVTPQQRALIEANYGKEDSACEAKIKDLYRTLKLPEVYAKQEQTSFNEITKLIEEQSVVPDVIFQAILKKIHGRQK